MKYFISLSIIVFSMISCNTKDKTEGNSTDSTKVDSLTIFGDTINEEGAINGDSLAKIMNSTDSAEVKFITQIVEVCQKKGCWMDVQFPEGNLMTVKFKDYGFFVPKDAAGKTVVMSGMIRKEIESVEWLKHKAEDAGKSKEEVTAITQPDTSYTFEATGVIIK